MKRDMDLIRTLLITIESANAPIEATRLTLPEYDQQSILYHVVLLSEADLIKANISCADNFDLPLMAQVERLTWQGHEFLDAARNDSVWQKAKDTVLSKAGTVSIAVFQAVLISIAKSQLNLQ
jgi:hypothetical protein